MPSRAGQVCQLADTVTVGQPTQGCGKAERAKAEPGGWTGSMLIDTLTLLAPAWNGHIPVVRNDRRDVAAGNCSGLALEQERHLAVLADVSV